MFPGAYMKEFLKGLHREWIARAWDKHVCDAECFQQGSTNLTSN